MKVNAKFLGSFNQLGVGCCYSYFYCYMLVLSIRIKV